jgi:hypothetical protein
VVLISRKGTDSAERKEERFVMFGTAFAAGLLIGLGVAFFLIVGLSLLRNLASFPIELQIEGVLGAVLPTVLFLVLGYWIARLAIQNSANDSIGVVEQKREITNENSTSEQE